MWLEMSVDDKLLQFTSFLSHMRKDYRLGAIVGIYIIFKNVNVARHEFIEGDSDRHIDRGSYELKQSR